MRDSILRGRDWLLRHRDALAAPFALAAVVCMALSAYHFRPQALSRIIYRPSPGGPQDYYDPSAPWWALAGALLLVIALAVTRRTPSAPVHTSRPLAALRPGWAWVLVAPGALTLLALAEANGRWIGVARLAGLTPVVQLALLGAGIALVVVGLAGLLPGRGEYGAAARAGVIHELPRREHRFRLIAAELALVIALALAALGLRLVHLGDSIHVLVDEAHFVLGVNYARAFPDMRLLEPMPTTASFPFIFAYGQSLTVELFGRSLLGLRAFSAILGALTVPALYFLGRALFDRTTALVAALVLLAFPPHLHYSRLALNNIADPLFGTLALAFFARGLRTHRRIDWVLAGVMLGLAQYFYEGGRLIYPALAAAWLAGGLIAWRPRPPVRGMLLAALAFVLVAAPMYYTLLAVDFPLADRMDKATYTDQYWGYEREEDNLATRWRHFKHALMHIVNAPENTVFHYYLYYGGRYALVLPWIVPLLLLGAVITLWRWWEPGVLLVPWVLATAAGNALLVESAVSARYVVAFPALALLIAVGLRHTLAIVAWPDRARRASLAISVLLAVGIAAGQAYYYFAQHLDQFNRDVREYPDADAEDALLRAVDFPPGTIVHLVGGRILPQRDAQHFMDFLADRLVVQVQPPQDITEPFLRGLRRDVDHAFFVAPGDGTTLALLARVFGERALDRTTNPRVPEAKAMLLYTLPTDPAAPPFAVDGGR